jgi:hypothetical protein
LSRQIAAHEVVQVARLYFVQPQGLGDGVDRARRDAQVFGHLEECVPLRTQARQLSHFFAAQARRSAAGRLGQTNVGWSQASAATHEERAQNLAAVGLKVAAPG